MLVNWSLPWGKLTCMWKTVASLYHMQVSIYLEIYACIENTHTRIYIYIHTIYIYMYMHSISYNNDVHIVQRILYP